MTMTKALSLAAYAVMMTAPMRCDQVPGLADGKLRPSATEGLQEAYIPIKFPSSHAANLLALTNGDILCVYFSGTWENESNLAIVVARLPHGSRKWGAPTVATQKEGWAFQHPVLFQSPRGPLWLLHTSQAAGAGQSEARMYALTSSDSGKSWSAPKLMFDQPGAFDRQRIVVIGKEWLLPMYFTQALESPRAPRRTTRWCGSRQTAANTGRLAAFPSPTGWCNQMCCSLGRSVS